MTPAVHRQLRLRPILHVCAGASLLQVGLIFWIGLPEHAPFLAIGILIGLGVGFVHWYYTVASMDLSENDRFLRWSAVFIGCVIFCLCLPGFSPGSFSTSLANLAAIGAWTIAYTVGLWLYDRQRGPFSFAWQHTARAGDWDFEARSSGTSIVMQRLGAGEPANLA